MPRYEYRCNVCGDVIELIRSMSERNEPAGNCGICSGELQRKQELTQEPQFNGSGFYETDYKNRGRKRKKTA